MDWLVPSHYSPERDSFVTSVHSWLIRTARHTILLDTCAGNHKARSFSPRFHMLDTPYLHRLAEAGVRPEQHPEDARLRRRGQPGGEAHALMNLVTAVLLTLQLTLARDGATGQQASPADQRAGTGCGMGNAKPGPNLRPMSPAAPVATR